MHLSPEAQPATASSTLPALRPAWTVASVASSKKISRALIADFHKRQHQAEVISDASKSVGEERTKSMSSSAASSPQPRKRVVESLKDLNFSLFRKRHVRDNSAPFHMDVFVFEFFTHLFYPLTIPVVITMQGRKAAVNKGFIPGKNVFKGQVMYTLLFLAPIVLLLVRRDEDVWAYPAVGIGSAYTAFRMLVTAGKYASFNRSYYRTVSHSDYDCLKDLLLRTITLDDVAVESMIDDAESETGIRLSDMRFLLADGVTQVNARVYASALARSVYRDAAPGSEVKHQLIRFVLGLLAGCFPLLRYLQYARDRSNGGTVALLVVSIVQTVAYSSIVFGFLGFAILFYHRMRLIKYAHINTLLFTGSAVTVLKIIDDGDDANATRLAAAGGEVSDDSDSDDAAADTAMIPACSARNLIVWATVGNVFCRFASSTNRRICFNFAANLVICLVLAGALILQTLNSNTADIATIAIISFVFLVTAVGMLISVLSAYLANKADDQVIKKLEEENFAFLWREQMVSSKAAEGGANTTAARSSASSLDTQATETYLPFLTLDDHPFQAEEYAKAMEIVRELIQRRNDVEPLRVMYVSASLELVSFFASICGSGVMLIVGILYQNSFATV